MSHSMYPNTAVVIGRDSISLPGGRVNNTVTAGARWHPASTLRMLDDDIAGAQNTVIIDVPFQSPDWTMEAGDWKLITKLDADRVDPASGQQAWTTYTQPGRTVHIGIASLIGNTDLFDAEEVASRPWEVVDRLAAFHTATGEAWRINGGAVGCAMVRATFTKGGAPLWHHTPETRGRTIREQGPLVWQRPLTDQDAPYPYVLELDLNASYLCAAGVAKLAHSELLPVPGPVQFDQRRAGMWQMQAESIPAGYWGRGRAPGILDPRRIADDGTVWASTDIVKWLIAHRVEVVIGDALISTPGETRELLRPWKDRVAQARISPLNEIPGVEKAVKTLWTDTPGMMARPGGWIHRPDWRWAILDTARMTLIRKLEAVYMLTGRWPIKVATDAAWWPVNSSDPQAAARELGIAPNPAELGNWKLPRNRHAITRLSAWDTERVRV